MSMRPSRGLVVEPRASHRCDWHQHQADDRPDVAAAGGWKDVTTLLTCYQHADEATMLKVMDSSLKLMSRRTAGGALEKR